jgi:hypothetical protein
LTITSRGRGRPPSLVSVERIYRKLGRAPDGDVRKERSNHPELAGGLQVYSDWFGETFADLVIEWAIVRRMLFEHNDWSVDGLIVFRSMRDTEGKIAIKHDPKVAPMGEPFQFGGPVADATRDLRYAHDILLGIVLSLDPMFPQPSIRAANGQRDAPAEVERIVARMKAKLFRPPVRALLDPPWVFSVCNENFTRYALGIPNYRWRQDGAPIMTMVVSGEKELFHRWTPPPCMECSYPFQPEHTIPCASKTCFPPDAWIPGRRANSREPTGIPLFGADQLPDVFRADWEKYPKLHGYLGGRLPKDQMGRLAPVIKAVIGVAPVPQAPPSIYEELSLRPGSETLPDRQRALRLIRKMLNEPGRKKRA